MMRFFLIRHPFIPEMALDCIKALLSAINSSIIGNDDINAAAIIKGMSIEVCEVTSLSSNSATCTVLTDGSVR